MDIGSKGSFIGCTAMSRSCVDCRSLSAFQCLASQRYRRLSSHQSSNEYSPEDRSLYDEFAYTHNKMHDTAHTIEYFLPWRKSLSVYLYAQRLTDTHRPMVNELPTLLLSDSHLSQVLEPLRQETACHLWIFRAYSVSTHSTPDASFSDLPDLTTAIGIGR